MKYKELCQKLYPIADKLQAESEINLLLESVGFSKKDFLLKKELPKETLEKILAMLDKRIEKRIPIQHILGYGYFMGEKFIVNEHVLIPRPETELLVEEIIKFPGTSCLDIGTGSGCIAIMTKKLTQMKVTACDISENAIKTAQNNAKNLSTEINFVLSDLFENITDKFDIIISNPPYIPLKDKTSLEPEVLLNEPHLALFASDEQGVNFYQRIIEASHNYLNPNGVLAFEIGMGQEKEIENILEQNNFKNIEIINDLSGIARIITAQMII